jgi:hypothetical protein
MNVLDAITEQLSQLEFRKETDIFGNTTESILQKRLYRILMLPTRALKR